MAGEPASSLLPHFLPLIQAACAHGPALDLACGGGRNGLYLWSHGVPVVFADRDGERLAAVRQQLDAGAGPAVMPAARTWQVDLEVPGSRPLAPASYGAILVFRYLHRPLLAQIEDAVLPGGVLVYETFTTAQAAFGRPTNPDFLLREGELRERFGHWNVHHDFEGVEEGAAGQPRAVARLVAAKPR